MKKHLNTLYVTTQKAYLHKEGQSVVVNVEQESKLRVPIHTLDGIVCFGVVSMSPFLMHHCAENNVAVSFLSEYGKFLARIQGPVSGNVLLRREQYRVADRSAAASAIARNILLGKIANARAVLRRALRDHGEQPALKTAENRLSQYLRRLQQPMPIEELRGNEGEAAASYFAAFPQLITVKDAAFSFRGRNRRPPTDPVNAMLSFAYTLLVHDCRSALEGVGLDPCVGYLHADRPGRPSLALDLMEEFRALLADRLVLSLINRRQIQPGDFNDSAGGAVSMTDAARKTLLAAWQKRKQEEIIHPYLEEKCKIGLLPHLQAQLLARHLRGDLDAYPPFIWK
ncbi:type I-C CRISPR-associated endonuclease Cas1c [Tichowtungia aerotolerans]|uniref:CRISPR-associated endonuclease Cas1 n=1 Tax=Tichowtungia aerotolerans TaxID=2697043 RepID=A0A6P1MC79_9BACT|nr:type I-C CRISPR-associated endonuclease Cas1c [Tichowtungia aerotolerans]QHI69688.1 type I-C CRISPR-associated endonuclease Cas1 [Tichowtungia aerotolerans]